MPEKKAPEGSLLARFDNYESSPTYFDLMEIDLLFYLYIETKCYEKASKVVNIGVSQHGIEAVYYPCILVYLYNEDLEALESLLDIPESPKYDNNLYKLMLKYGISLLKNDEEKKKSLVSRILSYPKPLPCDFELFFDIAIHFYDADTLVWENCKAIIYTKRKNTYLKFVMQCLIELNDFEKCLEICRNALDINPFDPNLWEAQTMVQYQMQNYTEALESINFVLTLDEDNTEISIYQIACLKEMKKYKTALKVLLKNKDKFETYFYYDNIFKLLLYLGKENAGINLLCKSLSKAKNAKEYKILFRVYIQALIMVDKYIFASQEIMDYLRKSPHDTTLLLLLCECYKRMDDKDSELNTLDKIESIDRQNARMMARKAILLTENQKYHQAFKYWKEISSMDFFDMKWVGLMRECYENIKEEIGEGMPIPKHICNSLSTCDRMRQKNSRKNF